MQGAAFGFTFDDVLPVSRFVDGRRHGRRPASVEVEVLHTPGHTPGSVCFSLARRDARCCSAATRCSSGASAGPTSGAATCARSSARSRRGSTRCPRTRSSSRATARRRRSAKSGGDESASCRAVGQVDESSPRQVTVSMRPRANGVLLIDSARAFCQGGDDAERCRAASRFRSEEAPRRQEEGARGGLARVRRDDPPRRRRSPSPGIPADRSRSSTRCSCSTGVANVTPQEPPRAGPRRRRRQQRPHLARRLRVLAAFGFVTHDQVRIGFRRAGSAFAGHVETKVPGVEWNTGNLGQGFSAAVGAALARKLREQRRLDLRDHGRRRAAEGPDLRGTPVRDEVRPEPARRDHRPQSPPDRRRDRRGHAAERHRGMGRGGLERGRARRPRLRRAVRDARRRSAAARSRIPTARR